MLQSEVTREQFALWSFQRDLTVGCYEDSDTPSPVTCWEDLPKDEQNAYLQEADYYINEHDKDDWPDDIMDRLKAP